MAALAVELIIGNLPAIGQPVHATCAAVLVLAGEGVYHDQAGGRHAIAPGTVFLHRPGIPHRIQRHRQSRWRQLVLRISPDAWRALCVFAQPPAQAVWRPAPGAEAALRALPALFADAAVPGWLVLARTAEALAQLQPPSPDRWAVAAQALAADRQRSIDLRELAARLGMSYSHFRRGFRLRFAVAPSAWRRSGRIAEAQRLLGSGAAPDTAARASGWGSGAAMRKAVAGVRPQPALSRHARGGTP